MRATVRTRTGGARRGLTLIEASMVLGLFAVVLAGILGGMSMVYSAQKITDAIFAINTIRQATKSVMAGKSDYSTLTQQMLVPYIPRRLVAADGVNIVNPWGGSINIEYGQTDGGGATGIKVDLMGLPQDGCMQMATHDFGSEVYQMKINTVTVALPASPSDVMPYCMATDNFIRWRFY